MYLNVNQIDNNSSGVTGYISWESWFAEEIDAGNRRCYRPGQEYLPSGTFGDGNDSVLMHGFYTVDGYSNNYSLEYKHRFREVIAEELERKMRKYRYTLTCGETGVIYSTVLPVIMQLKKGNTLVYEGLEFDMDAVRGTGM